MNPKGRCYKCRWWDVKGEDSSRTATHYECKRRCPIVICTGRVHNEFGPSSSGIETIWPRTSGTEWCGEWDVKQ